jgi:hyperosmotically inducible protein
MKPWLYTVTAMVLLTLPAWAAAQTTTTDKPKTTEKVEGKMERAEDKARAAGQKVSEATKDSWLTAKTKIALYADERVSGRHVSVETRNGVVTLRGKVGSAEEKSAAADIAKSVDGVKSVNNSLQVVSEPSRKAVDAKDADIKKAVKDRLTKDAQLKKAGIDVRADNGVVTLTGDVGTVRESARASEVARGVPGVRAVKNELKEKS